MLDRSKSFGTRGYIDFRRVMACPHCGKPIVPKELVGLALPFMKTMIAATLIRSSPRTFTHNDFNLTARSFAAYVSHLRTALRQTGMRWKIITIMDDPLRYYAAPIIEKKK